jgi:hypothetical protein
MSETFVFIGSDSTVVHRNKKGFVFCFVTITNINSKVWIHAKYQYVGT